jgi:DNA-binding CsgD family transcriptional regulator
VIEPTDEPRAVDLTAVELETLRLVADGLTDGQIAAALFMSEAAIKSRGGSIRAKLGAATRAHAVAIGYQRGHLIVDPEVFTVDARDFAAALQQAGYRVTRTGGTR